MQNKVSMGDIGNFARDFPQNAPRVPKQHRTKGSRGSTNDCVMRSQGSRKIREVSAPGRRWKVVKTCRRHGGFGDGEKWNFWSGRNSSSNAAEFSGRRETFSMSKQNILWFAEVSKRSTYTLSTRKPSKRNIRMMLAQMWG